MPKKSGWGVSEKVQEARDRKQQAKVDARHKEAKAKEVSQQARRWERLACCPCCMLFLLALGAGPPPPLLLWLTASRGYSGLGLLQDAYWAQHDNPRGKKDAKREDEVRQLACQACGVHFQSLGQRCHQRMRMLFFQ